MNYFNILWSSETNSLKKIGYNRKCVALAAANVSRLIVRLITGADILHLSVFFCVQLTKLNNIKILCFGCDAASLSVSSPLSQSRPQRSLIGHTDESESAR